MKISKNHHAEGRVWQCGMESIAGWFHWGRAAVMEKRAMQARSQPGQCGPMRGPLRSCSESWSPQWLPRSVRLMSLDRNMLILLQKQKPYVTPTNLMHVKTTKSKHNAELLTPQLGISFLWFSKMSSSWKGRLKRKENSHCFCKLSQNESTSRWSWQNLWFTET